MELNTGNEKTPHPWARGISIVFACALGVAWFLSVRKPEPNVLPAGQTTAAPAMQVASQQPAAEKPPVGEGILQGYAAASGSVQQDLTLVSHVLENFALLLKGDDPLPLGANEEIAAALRGRNRARLRFVADTNAVFNAHGQLVDRWGTPLYFHAISRDRLEIRSAGPDKTMWTPDDVQRQSDGTFLSVEGLRAPSLLEESLLQRSGRRK